ncbi:MAG TPA: amidase [Thermomicrobiales bacterium]|nr:amidase [Thermomicrobiales bacterium]
MAARGGVDELLTRPALELAALVRDGEVTSRELVEAALGRIAARADLNAFTVVDGERALAAADAIGPGDARPFAGVPIAIKDLAAAAGLPQAQGSALFGDYTPGYDAYAVRRIRAAGFVIVGKTSTPEFGIVPVTAPRRFGPTRNPWDTGRTPGGSSGGAAAAVAGGLLPLAHGSDGGGSLRIPAACCGLVGLKPSRGRVSAGPDLGDSFLSTQGALTRTVADTAALLDVMAGYEPGDATWAPPPAEPFAASAARAPRRLRVALTVESPLGTAVDPVCAAAAREAAELLASLGHEVAEAAPPGWRSEETLPFFTVLWAANVAAGVRFGGLVAGREPREADVEPLTWAFYRQGLATSAPEYLGALARLEAQARRIVSFFCDQGAYDVLLTPALGQRPVRIGEIDTCAADPLAEFARAADFTPFTPIVNVTGQPAVALPLFQGADGLPLGVQLVGPPAGEGLLLALAAQLEAARPWAGRRPAG